MEIRPDSRLAAGLDRHSPRFFLEICCTMPNRWFQQRIREYPSLHSGDCTDLGEIAVPIDDLYGRPIS